MSIKGLSPHPDTFFKKTFHHCNDSDELDVFEASRYFSGEPTTLGQKIIMVDEKQSSVDYWNKISGGGGGGARRISLDMPSMRNRHHHSLFSSSQHHDHTAADQKQMFKDKKDKQPSSPGGRLASFLNSLFSQSTSKKKKSKSTASTHDQDPDDSPGGGRRKRRSSISYFGITHTNPNHTTTIYSASSKNSGFRTPPAAYAKTPTKNAYRSVASSLPIIVNEKKNPDSAALSREKLRLRDERNKNSTTINKYTNSDWNKPVLEDVDGGGESDSSSDLFELQNYNLGDYSSGLPVYETTHMDSIKRGAPMSVHGP